MIFPAAENQIRKYKNVKIYLRKKDLQNEN